MSNLPPAPTLPPRGEARLAEIRPDISARLWPVNSGMSAADFSALMDQMSRLQLSFEWRAALGTSGQIDTRAAVEHQGRRGLISGLDRIARVEFRTFGCGFPLGRAGGAHLDIAARVGKNDGLGLGARKLLGNDGHGTLN